MATISSTPNLSLRQESDHVVHTSLLDNWRYQRGPMAYSHSLPQVGKKDMDLLESAGPELCLNINEDDEDCPGHGRYGYLTCSSSSEGLYSSSEEDSRPRAGSTMSVDDFKPYSDDDDVNGNNSNNNVTFSLPHDELDNEPEESDSEYDTRTPVAHTPTFFKMERRASFDNGVYGMPDRILRGEMIGSGSFRNALTAPGTPAEPSTPVGRYHSEEELMLNPEQVFNRIHSLLCAERVTQMTKTYNDIEAVTRLLEEKERDLELAARIGQTLLSKNKELASRTEHLDEQLTHANDKVNQLKHDLSMKDELLKFYCEDLQDQTSGDSTPGDGKSVLSKINVEMLQRKVGTLEEENLNLRLESAQLRADTDNYEEKEKKLVEDCLQQLAELNQQVETFAGELRLKSEESARQKEEITANLAQVADLHKRVRQLTVENMDLAEKLQASQESQRQLTKELSVQRDRYDELMEMLEEAQDELRGHRNRNNPKATRHLYASAALPSATGGVDSLASELENSLQQEKQQEEETKNRRARSWKVFETARAARKASSNSSRGSSVRMSTSVSTSQTPSAANSDNESFNSDGYSADMDSMYGSSTELGRPGIPGSNDLESALRRLAMRRANEMNELDFHEAHAGAGGREDADSSFRIGDTPDSVSSPPSGYSYLGYSASNHPANFKIPDKLQIVKPLEGSVTLKHWQRLAQPHLGGLFERREGVKVRGERKLDLEGEIYTLSDFEEDEDIVECPSRRMADSSTIYTFTNSMVSQPSEQSLSPLSSCASSGSLHPVGSSTPHSHAAAVPKRRNNYTMSLGLAAILQGRENSSTTNSMLRPIASCPVMPADSVATASSGAGIAGAGAPADAGDETASSINNPGLFGKLISTGYSLLWNKSEAPVSSAQSSLSSREGSPIDGAKSQQKPTAKQILPRGASTGVLGAIATFRKNGIL